VDSYSAVSAVSAVKKPHFGKLRFDLVMRKMPRAESQNHLIAVRDRHFVPASARDHRTDQ